MFTSKINFEMISAIRQPFFSRPKLAHDSFTIDSDGLIQDHMFFLYWSYYSLALSHRYIRYSLTEKPFLLASYFRMQSYSLHWFKSRRTRFHLDTCVEHIFILLIKPVSIWRKLHSSRNTPVHISSRTRVPKELKALSVLINLSSAFILFSEANRPSISRTQYKLYEHKFLNINTLRCEQHFRRFTIDISSAFWWLKSVFFHHSLSFIYDLTLRRESNAWASFINMVFFYCSMGI